GCSGTLPDFRFRGGLGADAHPEAAPRGTAWPARVMGRESLSLKQLALKRQKKASPPVLERIACMHVQPGKNRSGIRVTLTCRGASGQVEKATGARVGRCFYFLHHEDDTNSLPPL